MRRFEKTILAVITAAVMVPAVAGCRAAPVDWVAGDSVTIHCGLEGELRSIEIAALSKSGRYLAYGVFAEERVHVFDIKQRQCASHREHRATALAFSYGGELLCSVASNGRAHVGEPAEPATGFVITQTRRILDNAALSRAGNRLVVDEISVSLWHREQTGWKRGASVSPPPNSRGVAGVVAAWEAGSVFVAWGFKDHTIRLVEYSIPTLKEIRKLNSVGTFSLDPALACSPDGRHVLLGDHDGNVLVWDGSKRNILRVSDNRVRRAVWFKDATFIATSDDGEVCRINIDGLQRKFPCTSPEVAIWAWQLESDKMYVLTEEGRLIEYSASDN